MCRPRFDVATFIANEDSLDCRGLRRGEGLRLLRWPTDVTWEEWAMSGNDEQYDANSAVLVAAKQKAALQERAKMKWLACLESGLSAAGVGLERVGVDAD